ncbi:S-adenosyl-L-methionine-dependent methyltransferase [Plectosphaerella cucumerina]|uniref:S-adenosyl-L-methionine-dependent methyltransferase n=1 Tax=Plectosphaerella cucumerina TaxID=40658 RepID=A0A8K0TTU1_9PEZI|nr:S-adenosyl-L-methionine-dependent methyltransferase [Plectosphaerella cucumerina]
MPQTRDETVPLDEEYVPTVIQDGREYQQFALDNFHYFEPIDDHEMMRLSNLHEVLMLVFNNRLVPPELSRPRKILDLGSGTGDWAVEVAKTFPACEEDNLVLQVDNVNESFTWPRNEFDLVHSQMMVGAVNKDRWQPYVRDIFRTLRQGGWCEMVEIYFNAQSDNGTLTDDHALRRWSKGYLESIQTLKNPRAPLRMARWMREAGFIVNEEPRPIPLPTCGWSTDARQQEIGRLNRDQVRSMLSSVALYPMTMFQGMAVRDFEIMVAQARNEADNPGYKKPR